MTRGPTPAEFYAGELDQRRRAFERGHLPALREVLRLCREWNIPLPEWAMLAFDDLVQEKFFTPAKGKGKPGRRQSEHERRYTQLFIAFARWRAVEKALWQAAIENGQTEIVARISTAKKRKSGRPKRGELAPNALLYAAAAVAKKALKKSIAVGSITAILKDYASVAKAKAKGDAAQYDFDMSAPVPPPRNSSR